jgi:hypothetical protein
LVSLLDTDLAPNERNSLSRSFTNPLLIEKISKRKEKKPSTTGETEFLFCLIGKIKIMLDAPQARKRFNFERKYLNCFTEFALVFNISEM